MDSDFKVKVGEFEGPLDLLLSLIEKRKLHINDVSLSQVTDDFIAHLDRFEQMPMEDTANFILVASTLILIKSYSLVSTLSITEEEKANIDDLEKRLQVYQKVKELAANIKEYFGQQVIFQKEIVKNFEPIFTPSAEISTASLFQAMQSVISNLPKKETIPQTVVKKVISLEEVITNLTKRVQQAFKMKFSDIVKENKQERVNIIVSFLGMLELVKQGVIDVKQELLFDDIDMESSTVGVPRY